MKRKLLLTAIVAGLLLMVAVSILESKINRTGGAQ